MKKQIKLFLFVCSLGSLSLAWLSLKKNNRTEQVSTDSNWRLNAQTERSMPNDLGQEKVLEKDAPVPTFEPKSNEEKIPSEVVRMSRESAFQFLKFQRDIDGDSEMQALIDNWAQDPEKVREVANQMIDKQKLKLLYGDAQAEVRVFFNEVLIEADKNNPNETLREVISKINQELSQGAESTGRRDLDLVDLFTGYLNNRIGKDSIPINQLIAELGFTKATLPALRAALFYHSQKTNFSPEFVALAKSELQKLSNFNPTTKRGIQ